jgi:hypothetical protein
MTLPSRKKHPTTAPSFPRPATAIKRRTLWRRALAAGALCLGLWSASVSGSAAHAQDAAPARFHPDPAARAVSTQRVDWNERAADKDAAFETSSSGGALRWRIKQPSAVSTTASEKPASHKVAARASFASRAQGGSQVKFASANESYTDLIRINQDAEAA